MTGDQTNRYHSIDSYFDKVLYINMPGDKAREETLLTQLGRWNIRNVQRVDGVRVNAGMVPPERYRKFIKRDPKYVQGQLGCAEAHINAVKLAKQQGWKRVLILEDDVEILQDPNRILNQNAGILDDWDMLYFGGLVEPEFRNQIVCTHAYALDSRLYDDIIYMARASGMEIDNFYAKILQHMSYNHNQVGKWRIRRIEPFNQIVQNKQHGSYIR
jgi:GR25 family glycosyltransferase involved in LPS biosynthesis